MISVIIAAYNRAGFIEKAIQSVLDQTYKDFEIIIIDDGSSDNSEEIIKKIKDGRIHYHKLPENVGAGAARNIGVMKAAGDFITFLDSDDYYYDNTVLEKIDEASKKSDVISFRKYCVEKNDKRKSDVSLIKGDTYEWLMQHPLHYIGKPPYAIRKELFIEAGKFDESPRWGEALNLWRNIFRLGAKLEIIDDIGYVVCFHTGERVSTGGNVKERRAGKRIVFEVLYRAFNSHLDFLNKNRILKAVWLIILLRTAKSMRDLSKMVLISKQIFNNGLLYHSKAYYLLKSGMVTEG